MTYQNSNSDNQQQRLDPELLKKGLRCDLDQYDMLKRCLRQKRYDRVEPVAKKHEKEDALLEGAYLTEAYLKGANLGTFQLIDDETKAPLLGEVYLKGSKLEVSHLEGADLQFAHLEDTSIIGWLRRYETYGCRMEMPCYGRIIWKTDVAHAHLEGAIFKEATVDGLTSLWECRVDHKTNFLGVRLDVAKIDQRQNNC